MTLRRRCYPEDGIIFSCPYLRDFDLVQFIFLAWRPFHVGFSQDTYKDRAFNMIGPLVARLQPQSLRIPVYGVDVIDI
jgi:hypothetical protein